MPVAYLPSPGTGQWHLGPIAVHLYALCVVAGIVLALAVGERRYQAMGGRRWQIVDVGTVAVPAALVGGWLYRLAFGAQPSVVAYGGWAGALRVFDSGLGLPGAAACGLIATWAWCRRSGVAIGPVLVAVLPGLVFGQAVAVLGTWFSQSMYGPPSAMPWAVEITPYHRAPGFESFTYFQPLFLYQALGDVAVAVLLIYLIDRIRLTGVRALVLCVALQALAWLAAISFIIAGSAVRIGQFEAVAVAIAAAIYLFVTRSERGPESLLAARWVRKRFTEADGSDQETHSRSDSAPGGA